MRTHNTSRNAQNMGISSILTLAIITTSIIASGTYLLAIFPKNSLELTLGVCVFGLVLITQTILTLRNNSSSLGQASIFVFTYVFLWIAPIIQFTQLKNTLVNTTRYDEGLFLATNTVCAAFSAFFVIGTLLFKKRNTKIYQNIEMQSNHLDKPRNIGITVLISVFIALFSMIFSGLLFQGDGAFTPQGLLIRKYLFFIPSAAFLSIFFLYRADQIHGKKVLFYMFVLFACLLLTQNPGTEKRNALGPVYLAVVYIGLGAAIRNRSREILLLIVALLILFPITSIYTHARGGPGLSFDTDFYALIADHFVATHYDAWANIYATIEYTQDKGLQFGRQIAGSLLFFVPSHTWTDKPLATGILLGNYLSQNHMMWFNNLSAPLISEAFIDFHIFGVVCYALILSKVVTLIDDVLSKRSSAYFSALAIYWCFFLIFLLRGSLMIAIAYGLGATAAFLTVHQLIKPKKTMEEKVTTSKFTRNSALDPVYGD